MPIEQPPVLTLTDADGLPVIGCQVTVQAADPDTGEFLGNRAGFEFFELTLPQELQQIRSPTGASKSTVSNTNGTVTFPLLMLMDAVEGTCFQMYYYFLPISSYEIPMVSGLGVMDEDDYLPVVASSDAIFCAENKRSYSASAEPSMGVSPGIAVAQPPMVTIEQQLQPFYSPLDNTSTWKYYVPLGLFLGTFLMQLQPVTLSGELVPASHRQALGQLVLSQNLCLIRGSLEVTKTPLSKYGSFLSRLSRR